MAINRDELARHLDDYAKTMGEKADRFVCPITLRRCEEHELVNGHILNEALAVASNKTVIQYRDVDGYYGTRVEPSFVEYFNLTTRTELDLMKHCDQLTVQFSDGQKLKAFMADGRNARQASKRFPSVPLVHDGVRLCNVFLMTGKDDPRVKEQRVEVTVKHKVFPSHWTAAMLKAGYLAMFDMMGYHWIRNPGADSLRWTLKQFYEDKAKPSDAAKYFTRYQNAVQIVGELPPSGKPRSPKVVAWDYDTIEDRQCLLHHTPSRTIFAVSCIFKVNGASIMVALPYADNTPDAAATAAEFYERMMRDDNEVPQKAMRATYRDKVWRQVGGWLNMRYFDLKDFQSSQPPP